MEAMGINWMLLAAQLLNISILFAWIILAVLALMRVRQSENLQIRWLGALLVVFTPVLGAIAVLIIVPKQQPQEVRQ